LLSNETKGPQSCYIFSCNKLFHGSNKVSDAPKSHGTKHTYPSPHNPEREVLVFIIEMTITLLNEVCGFLVFALNGATITDPYTLAIGLGHSYYYSFSLTFFSFFLCLKQKQTHNLPNILVS